ncbi:MAG: DUF1178 family protein [Candidatus Accumulibacter sp.]|nr:DUF1178 family protein [Accumulibacter sp.]
MLLANCEDVGARFAEEARKIHYVEAPERSIRARPVPRSMRRCAKRESSVPLPYMKPDLH